MPQIKILMWNTQHLNAQRDDGPTSEAYKDKMQNLASALDAYKPNIVALFEVGTTGRQNYGLVEDLKGHHYVLAAALEQDGGRSKDTTLGSMVFVHTEASSFFSELGEIPLAPKANRASLVLKDPDGNLFAFCHANANAKSSYAQVADEIGLISQLGKLVFFGGDLNHHANEAAPSFNLPDDRVLKLCLPNGPGFTHVSIRNSDTLAKKKYRKAYPVEERFRMSEESYLASVMGTDILYGQIAIPSLLDFAYFDQDGEWKCRCDAAVNITTAALPQENLDLKTAGDFRKKRVYTEVHRLFLGNKLRSDHFPVCYWIRYA
jgi:hypothetical protein